MTIPTGTTIDASSLEFGNTLAAVKITGGTIHIANPTNSDRDEHVYQHGPIRLQTIESVHSGTNIGLFGHWSREV